MLSASELAVLGQSLSCLEQSTQLARLYHLSLKNPNQLIAFLRKFRKLLEDLDVDGCLFVPGAFNTQERSPFILMLERTSKVSLSLSEPLALSHTCYGTPLSFSLSVSLSTPSTLMIVFSCLQEGFRVSVVNSGEGSAEYHFSSPTTAPPKIQTRLVMYFENVQVQLTSPCSLFAYVRLLPA